VVLLILKTGINNGLSNKSIKYEMELYLLLQELITKQQKEKKLELNFIFDEEKTDHEIENNVDDYDPNYFRKNIDFLRKNMNDNIVVIQQPADVVPFVICDHYYLFGNSMKKNAYAILDCNPFLIKELQRDLNKIVSAQKNDSGIGFFQNVIEKYT